MSSVEDILKAYKEGYQDGYKRGKSELPSNPMPNTIPTKFPDYNLGCKVCGKVGFRSEVCYHPQCPTRITASEAITL
jgi:hypothetical protein